MFCENNIKRADRNAILSRLFGDSISLAREYVAAGLIKLHISANMLTLLGFLSTLAASIFLVFGAGDKPGTQEPGKSWYGLWAMALIFLASCFDILDGAVARNSQRITQLGGFIDSCLDRLADGAIFLGILIYYLYHPDIAHSNLFAIATVIALINSLTISYIKARAENSIDSCPVGFWQRGERLSAIMIGLACGHLATAIVMLAILPGFTVLRRFTFAARQLNRKDKNAPPLDPKAKLTGVMRLALWRYRRGSLPYDIATAFNIGLILTIELQPI